MGYMGVYIVKVCGRKALYCLSSHEVQLFFSTLFIVVVYFDANFRGRRYCVRSFLSGCPYQVCF